MRPKFVLVCKPLPDKQQKNTGIDVVVLVFAGNNRVIYGEQGNSFGDAGSSPNGGYVRVVKNLGTGVPYAESYKQEADAYYEYNFGGRTVKLFLTDNALRAFSNRELAPHNERSVINQPPKCSK